MTRKTTMWRVAKEHAAWKSGLPWCRNSCAAAACRRSSSAASGYAVSPALAGGTVRCVDERRKKEREQRTEENEKE
jgi:hypothetical protein